MDPPVYFRDSMVRGIFHRFDDDHFFEQKDGGTPITSVFDYTAPLGPLGRVVDALILERHMTTVMRERNLAIKKAAESNGWTRFVKAPTSPGSCRR